MNDQYAGEKIACHWMDCFAFESKETECPFEDCFFCSRNENVKGGEDRYEKTQSN